jgi:hypothetical protein
MSTRKRRKIYFFMFFCAIYYRTNIKHFSVLIYSYINTRGNWENSKLCENIPPFGRLVWYPDILPKYKALCPKDILPKDTLPNGHFADRRFAERTFCRTDILPNGHFAERTVCRKDNLPKIEMLFRQNVWDCDSFLNCVILNHCVKCPLYGH